MSNLSEKEFLDRLYEVVYKLSSIAKTQDYRFKKMWEYLAPLGLKPHSVRQIPLEKDKFYDDIDYRIEVLKTTGDAMVDGYYTIKSILQALYENYFLDSELMKNDFPDEEDQKMLKYMAARVILGNLIQYSKMDHETVPIKYNVIARHMIMMKLKGVKLQDIMDDFHKLNKNIELSYMIKLMEEIRDEGIINIEKEGDDYIYTLNKELKLSDEGQKQYVGTLRPIVDWPTHLWRSFYNIRELNLTVADSCQHNDFLCKILSKAATQGFGPAYYVFQNLVKYYEKVKAG